LFLDPRTGAEIRELVPKYPNSVHDLGTYLWMVQVLSNGTQYASQLSFHPNWVNEALYQGK